MQSRIAQVFGVANDKIVIGPKRLSDVVPMFETEDCCLCWSERWWGMGTTKPRIDSRREFCRTHDFAAQQSRCSGQDKHITKLNSAETSTRRHAFAGFLHMVAPKRQKGARNFGCSRDGSPPINGA